MQSCIGFHQHVSRYCKNSQPELTLGHATTLTSARMFSPLLGYFCAFTDQPNSQNLISLAGGPIPIQLPRHGYSAESYSFYGSFLPVSCRVCRTKARIPSRCAALRLPILGVMNPTPSNLETQQFQTVAAAVVFHSFYMYLYRASRTTDASL
jgi:hypothetical protein